MVLKQEEIGWIGCLLALPKNDTELIELQKQFNDRTHQSQSMKESSSFDDWVRFCTAHSSLIILRMMNTVEPGESPPTAFKMKQQIQKSLAQFKLSPNSVDR